MRVLVCYSMPSLFFHLLKEFVSNQFFKTFFPHRYPHDTLKTPKLLQYLQIPPSFNGSLRCNCPTAFDGLFLVLKSGTSL